MAERGPRCVVARRGGGIGRGDAGDRRRDHRVGEPAAAHRRRRNGAAPVRRARLVRRSGRARALHGHGGPRGDHA